jgi:hypothetical protein
MYASDRDIEMLDQLIDKIEEGLKKQGVTYKRLSPTREQKEEMLQTMGSFMKKIKSKGNYPGYERDLQEFARAMADLKANIIDNETKTSKPKMSIGEFFDNLKNKQQEAFPKEQIGDFGQGEDNEVCTCPACLNYHNFEEKLAGQAGDFDKTKFLIGKKVFHAKYFRPEDGSEEIIVLEKEENIKKVDVDPISRFQDLIGQLDEAASRGDKEKTARIINEIRNFKK